MSSHGTQAKEPLLRMVKRDTLSRKKAWGIRAAAFILSLVTGGIVILCLGHNPISVYISMVKGAWGSSTVIHETVKIAVPLLITAIGISFAFKMKFWNIGGEGQILVGAVAAGAFGLFTAHIFPKLPLVLLMMLASIVAGGIYGLLPAICKAKWGTNETLFTLMLNYIALAFIKYLMNGPWKAEGSSFPKIDMLVPGARLTKVLGVHWGWILALILVVVAYIYFNKTKQGYEIAVVGESNNTARYAGINVGRVFRRTMFLSGALCGLVGMLLFVQLFGFGTSLLAGSCTLVIMNLPTIMRTTEEALKTVPQSYREGAFALGAGKWRVIRTVVLPTCVNGIVTGCILTIGRILGESAALLFTAGLAHRLYGFFEGMANSGATLTVALYVYASERGDFDIAYAIAAILIILTVIINLITTYLGKIMERRNGQ